MVTRLGNYVYSVPELGSFDDKIAKSVISCFVIDDKANDVGLILYKYRYTLKGHMISYLVSTNINTYNFKKYDGIYKRVDGVWCNLIDYGYTDTLVKKVEDLEGRMSAPKMYLKYIKRGKPVILLNMLYKDVAKVSICFPQEQVATWWNIIQNSGYFKMRGAHGEIPVGSYGLNNMIVLGSVTMDLNMVTNINLNLGVDFDIDYSLVRNDYAEFWESFYVNAKTPAEIQGKRLVAGMKLSKNQLDKLFFYIDNYNKQH